MNDTKTYPACLSDDECAKFDTRKQKAKHFHACFQYFCYPWKEEPKTADKTKPAPFKSCRGKKDCKANGEKATCFRYKILINSHSWLIISLFFMFTTIRSICIVFTKDYFLHAHIFHLFKIEFRYVFSFDMGTDYIGVLENLFPNFHVNTHKYFKYF